MGPMFQGISCKNPTRPPARPIFAAHPRRPYVSTLFQGMLMVLFETKQQKKTNVRANV